MASVSSLATCAAFSASSLFAASAAAFFSLSDASSYLAVIAFLNCAIVGYKFSKQRVASAKRDPPKQKKEAGDKKAADASWYAPV